MGVGREKKDVFSFTFGTFVDLLLEFNAHLRMGCYATQIIDVSSVSHCKPILIRIYVILPSLVQLNTPPKKKYIDTQKIRSEESPCFMLEDQVFLLLGFTFSMNTSMSLPCGLVRDIVALFYELPPQVTGVGIIFLRGLLLVRRSRISKLTRDKLQARHTMH